MKSFDKLFRNVVPEFPSLSQQRFVFFIAKRLSTIIIQDIQFLLLYNYHIPTTFGSHKTNFEYILEYSFIYTMVSVKFLRNVPITYLCTNTIVFYSLGCKHCIIQSAFADHCCKYRVQYCKHIYCYCAHILALQYNQMNSAL